MQYDVFRIVRLPFMIPIFCSVFLFLFWTTGLWYPLLADTAIYGTLGHTLFTTGEYSLFGVPHSKYLPMYSMLTFPFTSVFGYRLGIKLLSFLAAISVIWLTHTLVRRMSSRIVADLTVLFLTVQHAFPIMSMFGASDLPFTATVLLSTLFFYQSFHNHRWYIASGIFLGIAILIRYNALPLIPLFSVVHLYNTRKFSLSNAQFRSFLLGTFFAILPFSLWLLRNYLVFGVAFPSDYLSEQSARGGLSIANFVRNAVFYINPLHTIGAFFPFALFGLYRYAKQYCFTVCAMCALWLLATFWWSLGVRHLFPGFPFLLFFAALGFVDIWNYARQFLSVITLSIVLVLPMIFVQSSLLCLYSLSECNAAVDRLHLSFIPKDLGLTQEGMYAWQKAAEWINKLPPNSLFIIPDASEKFVMHEEYFHDHLIVFSADEFRDFCRQFSRSHPMAYTITQRSIDDMTTVIDPDTMDFLDLSPKTRVKIVDCSSFQ